MAEDPATDDPGGRLAVTAEAASHGGLFGIGIAAVAALVAWLLARGRRRPSI